MYPFGSKPLDKIDAQDILGLIPLEIEENQWVDYKTDFKRASATKLDVLELRKDVTAFANAAGGMLVVGLPEDNKKPGAVTGDKRYGSAFFDGKTSEQIEKEINNALWENVTPALPNVEVRAIPVPDDASRHFCLIAVDGQSWRAPHFYKENSSHPHVYFYIRNGSDCRPMKHEEMAEVFDRTRSQRETVVDYWDYLISDAKFGECRDLRMLILNFFPGGFERSSRRLDLKKLKDSRNRNNFSRLGFAYWEKFDPKCQSIRYDFDGLNLVFVSGDDPDTPLGTSKIARNGCLQLIDGMTLSWDSSPDQICSEVNSAIHCGWDFLVSLGLKSPFDVGLTTLHPFGGGLQTPPGHSHSETSFPMVRFEHRESLVEDSYFLLEHIAQTYGVGEPSPGWIKPVDPIHFRWD